MPKIVEFALKSIACTRNGFGGSVQISGNTSGSTFMNNPDDPNDLKETRELFPFPAGPISIAQGETKSITMEGVRFSLNSQTFDPPDLTPHFLKVVGDLNNGLGSKAFIVRSTDTLVFAPSTSEPPEHPTEFRLDYETSNLAISLTFTGFTVQVF